MKLPHALLPANKIKRDRIKRVVIESNYFMKTYNSRSELMLARGRIRPLFIHYAAPGVVAMLFLAFQSIVDGLIVGRLIGANALAAVNIVAPTYALMSAIALIIGVGTQAQMSIYMGRGSYVKAKSAFRSGLTGIAAFAVASTVFVNVFAYDIAVALGANEALLPLAVGYIHGVMPWLAGIGGLFFFDYVLKALGHPRYAMGIMVGTIVMNIMLSLIFVGILKMSTFGVGLGTGISFTAGAVVYGVAVWRQLRRTETLKHVRGRFSWLSLWRIGYNGSSEGLTEIAMSISLFLFNITLMRYAGEKGVAAFTIVSYVLFIGTSFLLGIANGVIPVISYNFGARAIRRVMRTVRLAVGTNFLIGAVSLSVLQLTGGAIVRLFIDPAETQVIGLAMRGAQLLSLAFLFNGFNIFAASFFTAIDKAGLSLVVASLRGLILLVAGLLTLPHWWGVDGIWLTVVLTEALTSAVAAVLVRREFKRFRKMESEG